MISASATVPPFEFHVRRCDVADGFRVFRPVLRGPADGEGAAFTQGRHVQGRLYPDGLVKHEPGDLLNLRLRNPPSGGNAEHYKQYFEAQRHRRGRHCAATELESGDRLRVFARFATSRDKM